MAALAIRSGGAAARVSKSQLLNDDRSHHLSLSFSTNIAVKNRRPVVSSMALSNFSASSSSLDSTTSNKLIPVPFDGIKNDEDINEPSSRVSEKLDEWVRDSVGDIVKNLQQAPLLVQVYANNNNGPTKVKMEKAVPESWPDVLKVKPSPDGIILVEELAAGEREKENDSDESTRAWGVLIQGKGKGKGSPEESRECGSACYLLKTSRVNGAGGLGLAFCTHFCLVKVKSFGDSALAQLTDSWLLR